MSKDNRAGMLRVFRIICAVLVLALLGVAVVYAVLEISPAATLAGQATRAGDALALVARFYQWMLARKVLNVAVLVVCAALFLVMAAKKSGQFGRVLSIAFLVLGVLFAVLGVASFWVAEHASVYFPSISDEASALVAGGVDVSAFALAATFVLLSFLFRYARELYLDSAEIL